MGKFANSGKRYNTKSWLIISSIKNVIMFHDIIQFLVIISVSDNYTTIASTHILENYNIYIIVVAINEYKKDLSLKYSLNI